MQIEFLLIAIFFILLIGSNILWIKRSHYTFVHTVMLTLNSETSVQSVWLDHRSALREQLRIAKILNLDLKQVEVVSHLIRGI